MSNLSLFPEKQYPHLDKNQTFQTLVAQPLSCSFLPSFHKHLCKFFHQMRTLAEIFSDRRRMLNKREVFIKTVFWSNKKKLVWANIAFISSYHSFFLNIIFLYALKLILSSQMKICFIWESFNINNKEDWNCSEKNQPPYMKIELLLQLIQHWQLNRQYSTSHKESLSPFYYICFLAPIYFFSPSFDLMGTTTQGPPYAT